ncbi:hypothetical protein GXW74_15685 [Roseomonas eburnea]|uniref:Uncharacterized protein n=1 Tax=Neoroseomonas eburnea TaxID=1346889 RepID=A0A9X9XE00_9PROT|nr:hypothetical protein [Neoroseomonas eburnea]MBR0681936.1 hypothetical protein [Neoroseomonas eburnea]
MRAMPITLSCLMLAAPALGQSGDAAARVRQEAESYLRPCAGVSGDDARWCDLSRSAFVADYLRARAGQYYGQRNVAYMLRGSTPGIAADHTQSCAWRLVIMAQGHSQTDASDTANVRFDCGRISEQDQAAARARAMALAQQIATDPVRNPPRTNPAPRPSGAVDSTARPLGADLPRR